MYQSAFSAMFLRSTTPPYLCAGRTEGTGALRIEQSPQKQMWTRHGCRGHARHVHACKHTSASVHSAWHNLTPPRSAGLGQLLGHGFAGPGPGGHLGMTARRLLRGPSATLPLLQLTARSWACWSCTSLPYKQARRALQPRLHVGSAIAHHHHILQPECLLHAWMAWMRARAAKSFLFQKGAIISTTAADQQASCVSWPPMGAAAPRPITCGCAQRGRPARCARRKKASAGAEGRCL